MCVCVVSVCVRAEGERKDAADVEEEGEPFVRLASSDSSPPTCGWVSVCASVCGEEEKVPPSFGGGSVCDPQEVKRQVGACERATSLGGAAFGVKGWRWCLRERVGSTLYGKEGDEGVDVCEKVMAGGCASA